MLFDLREEHDPVALASKFQEVLEREGPSASVVFVVDHDTADFFQDRVRGGS